jgi:hypothetical protein
MPSYAGIPPECPAVNITMDTLEGQLKHVILDRDLRRQLALAGRRFVETYNNHFEITENILRWLKPGGIVKYDFIPHTR